MYYGDNLDYSIRQTTSRTRVRGRLSTISTHPSSRSNQTYNILFQEKDGTQSELLRSKRSAWIPGIGMKRRRGRMKRQ